jgi:hypothetical protein
MKYRKSMLASGLFVGLLLCIYYIHISFFKVNVVLYSALLDGLIASAIGAAFLLCMGYFRDLIAFEKLQLAVIWLLASYIFAISIPTVIDRSLSLYLLEKIQQRGGGVRLDRFEDVFTKEYVKEDQLIAVRLTEQLQSGTITVQNGCVKLTARGQALATFSRYFRLHFLPKQRLLMGDYSHALTDPFRNSEKTAGYECK